MTDSRGRLTVRFAIACSAIGLALPAFAGAAETNTYLVQLTDEPLASYTGGTKGIPGTSPKVTRNKLKADSAAGLDYRSYLASRQDAVLKRLGGAEVVQSYRFAAAGFAAELTAGQAARAEKDPAVARVWKDTLVQPQQAADADARLGGFNGDGASYLRLPTGLWNQLGGPVSRNGAGAGVIVGVIDTGIQPGHPSFADRGSKFIGQTYQPPAVWDGACQSGDGFATSDCNNKLIGARYFVDGFGRNRLDPKSHLSPRDDDGHGTHTASTAAGNYGVDPTIDSNDLGVDIISGISPRSYVAAYKVCWEGPTPGCSTADTVKAVDAAVADGVDVINYSVGSDTSTVIGLDSIAFLNAADAGVFVANSAGNAGPGAGTVGSPASVPWLTTVGASTLARSFTSTVTVKGASEQFTVKGASVTKAVADAPLVDAANAGGELCQDGQLDAAKVAGKIVLCLRGVNDRINKSLNVSRAGGVGMILYNPTDAQDVDTDTHWVPSAHVNFTDGKRIKDAIARGPATASLSQGAAGPDAGNRVMAAFSSRGPQKAVPDLPKPDVVAPGVQVLAGAADQPAPSTNLRPGQLFQAIGGTSMASPHVAGAGALLTQAHPTLSPAELKSQLMLTANPDVRKEDGKTPADVFDRGSGEIDPNKAAGSGLVLDTTYDDYLSYLEYVDPTIVGGDIPKTRPNDLNLASISFSKFAGKDSTTRVLESIDSTATRWTVSVEGLTGVRATASTGQFFTIRPGQTQAITVALQQVDAPLDKYVSGSLVLSSGERVLRIPISIKPIPVAAPARIAVAAPAASGTQDVTVTPGFTGRLSAVGWGLAAAKVDADKRITATSGELAPGDPGTQLYPVTVPAGAQLLSARFGDVDDGAADTDLDLFLLRDADGDGNFANATVVASSTSATSVEDVTLPLPPGGSYAVAVVGFQTAAGGTVYDLSTWLVNDGSPDDPANAPGIAVTGDGAVTAGTPATLKLAWSGVNDPGTYLGVVTYHATDAPTAGNIAAYSLVELTRSGGAGATPPSSGTTPPTGGDASSGTDPGAATPGGASSGGATPDGSTPGGSTPGGSRPGGSTPGGSTPDGATPGGATPGGADVPAPAAAPRAAAPSPRAASPALTVRSATLRGRTLTVTVRGTAAGTLRASVKHGKRFVAKAAARRVAGRTVRLTLDRRLARGTYAVKVIAGAKTVRTLRIRVR